MEKKGFFNKDYTRRQFLKMSGKGAMGITMTGAMLSLIGCTAEEVEQGDVGFTPLPQGLLVANRAKCVGCQRCETNCTLQNDGNVRPAFARLNVRDSIYVGENGVTDDYKHGDGLYGLWTFGPKTCKQCAEPACAAACPVTAIYADETTGTRMIDQDTCVGCGACANACPWGMPKVNPDTKKSSKCINCGACVAGCPTGALSIVEWTDVVSAL